MFGKVEWPVKRDRRCLIIIPSSRIDSSISISSKPGKRNRQYPADPLQLLLGVAEGHILRVIVLRALNIYNRDKIIFFYQFTSQESHEETNGQYVYGDRALIRKHGDLDESIHIPC